MAPDASLILVEAEDRSFTSLSKAVQRAGEELQKGAGGVVSISWSWNASDMTPDRVANFEAIVKSTQNVTYVVATGESLGVTVKMTAS